MKFRLFTGTLAAMMVLAPLAVAQDDRKALADQEHGIQSFRHE